MVLFFLRERRALQDAAALDSRHLSSFTRWTEGGSFGAAPKQVLKARGRWMPWRMANGLWPPEAGAAPRPPAGRTVCDAAVSNPKGCRKCILTETLQKEQQRTLHGSKVDFSGIVIQTTQDEMKVQHDQKSRHAIPRER